ncbi:MAG: anti-sigma factor [Gemmatimonadales bacterium]|nr:anti-sigma factor [Gemmatimonadales bacterium]
MSAHLNQELSAYLDGELHGDELAVVEAHLAECEECRTTLESLRGLVRRAQTLDDRPPERDLWAGIASRIGDASTADVVPLSPRRRRFAFSVPQLAAAAIAVMAVSAGSAVVMMRGAAAPQGTASAPRGGVVTAVVLSPADDAFQAYAPAIQQLELLLAGRRSQLDTSTVRVLQQSLLVIDSAIAQARHALEADPNNQYLNSHLRNALGGKLDVLRRAATMPTVS